MTRRPHRWLQAVGNLVIVVVLLAAISFLPPDTSLKDRQKAGVLKLCVPTRYPPLITGDPQQPGFDVELANAVAGELKLRLLVNTLSSIGSDFNPRNWSLTRGQCDIIAGGVADTEQTRSFLQTIPTPAQIGWVGISATGSLPVRGDGVTVLPGTSGLNRLQLSGWLREQGFKLVPARTPQQFVEALDTGRAAAGITESFVAASLPLPTGHRIFWLPDHRFPHFRMALGLWKGDQTLKAEIASALNGLERSGKLGELARRYNLGQSGTLVP